MLTPQSITAKQPGGDPEGPLAKTVSYKLHTSYNSKQNKRILTSALGRGKPGHIGPAQFTQGLPTPFPGSQPGNQGSLLTTCSGRPRCRLYRAEVSSLDFRARRDVASPATAMGRDAISAKLEEDLRAIKALGRNAAA